MAYSMERNRIINFFFVMIKMGVYACIDTLPHERQALEDDVKVGGSPLLPLTIVWLSL